MPTLIKWIIARAAPLLLALAAQAANAATFDFTNPVGGGEYPTCSGGTWSRSGSTYTCTGSITLASGDNMQPGSSITVVANNGFTLNGNNTIGSATNNVNLQTAWTGITASSGVAIYGNVAVTGGAISLQGGSVSGSVSSNCCAISTTNTDIGGGISSGSNAVAINGGTIAGAISGIGVSIQNATIASGSITSSNPISISNSTVGSSASSVTITGSNTVTLSSSTTVFGSVTAGAWPGAMTIDSTSTVVGSCSPSHARCVAACTSTTVGSDTVVTCIGNGSISIPSNVSSVRYLIVAGGGGGGGIDSGSEDGAGGGGAGGVLSGTSLAVTPGTTYAVTVGAGGTAGTGSVNGGNGGDSTFATLTATGGGGGAREGGHDGLAGGSGGGGSDNNAGGSGTAGQGNSGGNGNNNDGGGGGGGAGAAGADGTNDTGGNGGSGVANDISGTTTYYGGGGGGGADDNGAGGTGGSGGGGAGGSGRAAGTNGTANTGGGGGGATGSSSGIAYNGGAGGSGIVIVRYPTAGTPGAGCNSGTVSGVINTYYPVSASLSAGATSITVGTATGASTALAQNDLVLIVQMQDASIDTTNTSSYGTASSINAGKYEYAVVSSVAGSTVTLTSGLTNSYTRQTGSDAVAQKSIQLIRVPVFSSATLGSGTTASAWNGSTGGILAFDVTGALALNGATIDMSGKGFRGGGGRQLSGGSGANTDYRTLATNNANASKGEGIAGTPRYLNNGGSLQNNGVEGYPNGSYARGAPATAGGGGTDDDPANNDENTGGGGGANAGGGGYGGYAWSASASPGRGIGGAAVTSSASRLILGSGGGSGTTNNGTGSPGSGFASSGAAGGGLVMIRAGSLTGTATINVNGANANNTVLNDGSGGGGAGGTVMVYAGSGLSGLSVTAAGGNGGTNTPGGSGDHGPGGGGGGGYVLSSSALSSCTVSGGAAGTTASGGNYGATAGSAGLCATTLTAGQIIGKTLGSGPCASSVASFLVDAPGSASTCGTAGGSPAAPIVTVTAKDGAAGAGNTVASYTGTVALTTSTGRGTWAKVSGQADGTLTGSDYTFVASDSGDAQFYLVSGVGEDLTVTASDGSASGTSGTVQFRDNAFVVTPTDALATTVVAGRDHAMKIEFWKKDTTSGLCGIETSYTGSHNLDAWYTADADHPAGATAPSIGAVTLPAADPGGAATNNLALTFTDGVATFNLTTSDVGKYDLNFQDDSRSFSSTLDISGSSSTLTVKPFALHASVSGNPAASAASGAVFTTAGTGFSATVRGVLWQAADDANNDGTPELTGSALNAALADNAVAPHFAWATTLTPDTTSGTYTPAGGTLGALSNGSIAKADYSSGAATASTLQYAEVGSFTLLANATNYLNTSGVGLAANAGVVGRFRPHHFLMTGTLTNRQGAGCAPAASFTYMDEPFRVALDLTAEKEGGGTTVNYDSTLGFARLTAASASWLTHGANSTLGVGAIDGTTNLTARLSVSGTPSGTWASGVASLVADIVMSRPTAATPDATWGPYAALKIGAMPQDADGTTLLAAALDLDVDTSGANERKLAGTTAARYGRLRVANAFGSEHLALVMPALLEYYDSGRWRTNTLDSCTTLATLAGPTAALTVGTGTSTPRCNVAANTCTTTSGVACNAASAISSGSAGLCLTAPGAVGQTDVTFAPPAYLQHSSGALTGRAGFGLYNQSGNSTRIIFRREVR